MLTNISKISTFAPRYMVLHCVVKKGFCLNLLKAFV